MAATRQQREANRKRSIGWKVQDDEYHPDPRVAAEHADAAARRSSLKYLDAEIERLEKNGPRQSGEVAATAHADNLAHLHRERARILGEMEERKEEKQEADEPTATVDKKSKLASLASRISRAKKAGDQETVDKLEEERAAVRELDD
jgi:hypothetical protein